MINRGWPDSGSGALVRWWLQRSTAERRSFLVALLLSLCVHVGVLLTARPPRLGDARLPVFRVTVVGTFRAPETASTPSVPAPAAAVPAPPPPSPAAATAPAPVRSESTPATASSPAATVPLRRAPPAAVVPEAAPRSHDPELIPPTASKDAPLRRREGPEAPANPLSSPELGVVVPSAAGRRIQARLWIDERGKVSDVNVKIAELDAEVATRVATALRSLRFPPPTGGDQPPAATVLDTFVCFGSDGALDVSSPGCLRPPAAEQPAAPQRAASSNQ